MSRQCAACGASNPDGAGFCGQCYGRFEAPDHADPAHSGPGHAGPPHPDPARAQPVASSRAPGLPAVAGRFTAVDGELTWRCAVCDTANPVAAFTCTVCGTRMDVDADPATAVDWAGARRVERLVPGLGYLRAGQSGMGAARTGIVVLWLLGAVALALGGASGVATAIPLLVGVAVVWATGPADLDALRVGRSPRLDPRGFTYVVIAVTMGVIIGGAITILL